MKYSTEKYATEKYTEKKITMEKKLWWYMFPWLPCIDSDHTDELHVVPFWLVSVDKKPVQLKFSQQWKVMWHYNPFWQMDIKKLLGVKEPIWHCLHRLVGWTTQLHTLRNVHWEYFQIIIILMVFNKAKNLDNTGGRQSAFPLLFPNYAIEKHL